MIREGVPLSFGRDRFEGIVRTPIGVVFSQYVVRMIVNDWETLYELTKVFLGCMIEVGDVMEMRICFRLWRHSHGGC